MLDAIAAIKAKLPFLVDLTSEERHDLPNLPQSPADLWVITTYLRIAFSEAAYYNAPEPSSGPPPPMAAGH